MCDDRLYHRFSPNFIDICDDFYCYQNDAGLNRDGNQQQQQPSPVRSGPGPSVPGVCVRMTEFMCPQTTAVNPRQADWLVKGQIAANIPRSLKRNGDRKRSTPIEHAATWFAVTS